MKRLGELIAEAPLGRLHKRILYYAALGVLMDGYDFFIMPPPCP